MSSYLGASYAYPVNFMATSASASPAATSIPMSLGMRFHSSERRSVEAVGGRGESIAGAYFPCNSSSSTNQPSPSQLFHQSMNSSKAILTALKSLQDTIRRLENEHLALKEEAKSLVYEIDRRKVEYDQVRQINRLSLQEDEANDRLAYERLTAEKHAVQDQLNKAEEERRGLLLKREELETHAQTADAARQVAENRVLQSEEQIQDAEEQLKRMEQSNRMYHVKEKKVLKQKEERMRQIASIKAILQQEKGRKASLEAEVVKVQSSQRKTEKFLAGVLAVNENLVSCSGGASRSRWRPVRFTMTSVEAPVWSSLEPGRILPTVMPKPSSHSPTSVPRATRLSLSKRRKVKSTVSAVGRDVVGGGDVPPQVPKATDTAVKRSSGVSTVADRDDAWLEQQHYSHFGGVTAKEKRGKPKATNKAARSSSLSSFGEMNLAASVKEAAKKKEPRTALGEVYERIGYNVLRDETEGGGHVVLEELWSPQSADRRRREKAGHSTHTDYDDIGNSRWRHDRYDDHRHHSPHHHDPEEEGEDVGFAYASSDRRAKETPPPSRRMRKQGQQEHLQQHRRKTMKQHEPVRVQHEGDDEEEEVEDAEGIPMRSPSPTVLIDDVEDDNRKLRSSGKTRARRDMAAINAADDSPEVSTQSVAAAAAAAGGARRRVASTTRSHSRRPLTSSQSSSPRQTDYQWQRRGQQPCGESHELGSSVPVGVCCSPRLRFSTKSAAEHDDCNNYNVGGGGIVGTAGSRRRRSVPDERHGHRQLHGRAKVAPPLSRSRGAGGGGEREDFSPFAHDGSYSFAHSSEPKASQRVYNSRRVSEMEYRLSGLLKQLQQEHAALEEQYLQLVREGGGRGDYESSDRSVDESDDRNDNLGDGDVVGRRQRQLNRSRRRRRRKEGEHEEEQVTQRRENKRGGVQNENDLNEGRRDEVDIYGSSPSPTTSSSQNVEALAAAIAAMQAKQAQMDALRESIEGLVRLPMHEPVTSSQKEKRRQAAFKVLTDL